MGISDYTDSAANLINRGGKKIKLVTGDLVSGIGNIFGYENSPKPKLPTPGTAVPVTSVISKPATPKLPAPKPTKPANNNSTWFAEGLPRWRLNSFYNNAPVNTYWWFNANNEPTKDQDILRINPMTGALVSSRYAPAALRKAFPKATQFAVYHKGLKQPELKYPTTSYSSAPIKDSVPFYDELDENVLASNFLSNTLAMQQYVSDLYEHMAANPEGAVYYPIFNTDTLFKRETRKDKIVGNNPWYNYPFDQNALYLDDIINNNSVQSSSGTGTVGDDDGDMTSLVNVNSNSTPDSSRYRAEYNSSEKPVLLSPEYTSTFESDAKRYGWDLNVPTVQLVRKDSTLTMDPRQGLSEFKSLYDPYKAAELPMYESAPGKIATPNYIEKYEGAEFPKIAGPSYTSDNLRYTPWVYNPTGNIWENYRTAPDNSHYRLPYSAGYNSEVAEEVGLIDQDGNMSLDDKYLDDILVPGKVELSKELSLLLVLDIGAKRRAALKDYSPATYTLGNNATQNKEKLAMQDRINLAHPLALPITGGKVGKDIYNTEYAEGGNLGFDKLPDIDLSNHTIYDRATERGVYGLYKPEYLKEGREDDVIAGMEPDGSYSLDSGRIPFFGTRDFNNYSDRRRNALMNGIIHVDRHEHNKPSFNFAQHEITLPSLDTPTGVEWNKQDTIDNTNIDWGRAVELNNLLQKNDYTPSMLASLLSTNNSADSLSHEAGHASSQDLDVNDPIETVKYFEEPYSRMADNILQAVGSAPKSKPLSYDEFRNKFVNKSGKRYTYYDDEITSAYDDYARTEVTKALSNIKNPRDKLAYVLYRSHVSPGLKAALVKSIADHDGSYFPRFDNVDYDTDKMLRLEFLQFKEENPDLVEDSKTIDKAFKTASKQSGSITTALGLPGVRGVYGGYGQANLAEFMNQLHLLKKGLARHLLETTNMSPKEIQTKVQDPEYAKSMFDNILLRDALYGGSGDYNSFAYPSSMTLQKNEDEMTRAFSSVQKSLYGPNGLFTSDTSPITESALGAWKQGGSITSGNRKLRADAILNRAFLHRKKPDTSRGMEMWKTIWPQARTNGINRYRTMV